MEVRTFHARTSNTDYRFCEHTLATPSEVHASNSKHLESLGTLVRPPAELLERLVNALDNGSW